MLIANTDKAPREPNERPCDYKWRSALLPAMPLGDVRENLRAAAAELEDLCEAHDPNDADWLLGIASHLRYLAEGDRTDPEALVFPDPAAIDSIGEQLGEAITEAQGDVRTRLRRARDDVLLVVAKLEDSLENQRNW